MFCFSIVVRALVKEFSAPSKSDDVASKQSHVNIQPPSKFKSSGFQSFKNQIRFPVSRDENAFHGNKEFSSSDHYELNELKGENVKTDHVKQQFLAVPTSSVSKRLSKSMESLDNILKELSDVIANEPSWVSGSPSQKRFSSSLLDLNDITEFPNHRKENLSTSLRSCNG